LSKVVSSSKEKNVNRNLASALAIAAATVGAAVAVGNAYADDITVENTPFVSSTTRAEAQAELKTPYLGGYPWSSQYNMHPISSALASEQVVREYKMSRDEFNALIGEDSGSAQFKRTPARNASAVMGGPAVACCSFPWNVD
jgi:hypothetical protein